MYSLKTNHITLCSFASQINVCLHNCFKVVYAVLLENKNYFKNYVFQVNGLHNDLWLNLYNRNDNNLKLVADQLCQLGQLLLVPQIQTGKKNIK